MSNPAKFVLRLAPILPGNFGPTAYSVWSADYSATSTVRDGEVVEQLEQPYIVIEDKNTDDEYSYLCCKVRLADGFFGTTIWYGFEPV